MSKILIEEIRQRLENATPGPWESDRGATDGALTGNCNDAEGASVMAGERDYIIIGGSQDEQGGCVGVCMNADAEFIAHSITDVEALLEVLDLMTDALEFYAAPQTYTMRAIMSFDRLDADYELPVLRDEGKQARDVLKGLVTSK